MTPCHDSARRREVRVDLFSSEEVDPSYVSDSMTLVETIVLPLDMTRVEHEDVYFIDLSFKFGAVEIEVGARACAGLCCLPVARLLLACCYLLAPTLLAPTLKLHALPATAVSRWWLRVA